MAEEFSPSGYRTLLGSLFRSGYEVTGFHNADPDRQHLVLRHDVDMCLESAVEMSELEARAGVSATYFVHICSDFYNPLSNASQAQLKRIMRAGHEIGLHFDAALYNDSMDVLDEAAAKECAILEKAAGTTVTMISFHRPAQALIGLDREIAGRSHTYMPRFFDAMGYCSDSRGGWHHGGPLDHDAIKTGMALQLLTHPIWWLTKGKTPQEKLLRFLEQRAVHLDHELGQHCSAHSSRIVADT